MARRSAAADDEGVRRLDGNPHVWGAAGPDTLDCPGLAQAAYHAAGISLPRTRLRPDR